MVSNRSLNHRATRGVYAINIISSKRGLATRYQLTLKNIGVNGHNTVFKGGFQCHPNEFTVGSSLVCWLRSLKTIQDVFHRTIAIPAPYCYLSGSATISVALS
jgi:hypothetical protein